MRFVLVLLFLIVVGGPGFGQGNKDKTTKANKPDFTGLWRVDTGKSESKIALNGTKGEKGVRKKENSGEKDITISTLSIEHHDPELKVTEKSEYNPRVNEQVTYYTDGRGETNSEIGGKTIQSKSKWDGKTMVTTVFRKPEPGKKADTIIARITWELSKDGKTLTTIWKPVDPRGGPQSMERLYYSLFQSKTIYQRAQD